ncbi:MAG: phosphate ABC transporter substrate-binding protein [Sandaracinaceae bacterium]|nr:phosphate ABC transporter substrate-binding protein [Sandaracinaceae bacterium]
MNTLSRILCLIGFLASVSLALSACGNRYDEITGGEGAKQSGGRQTLTIKGSDTMVILAQRWAEGFMAANANSTIQVSGGGSGTGIAALINGTTDLANSSRKIKEREIETVRKNRSAEVVETPVAIDTIAVYVSEKNPVKKLNIETIKQIYRGRIKNWSEVGGPDLPIVLYSRENNSGTYAYFKEQVLDDEDFVAEAQTLPGTASVINAVARDEKGIGYGGIAFGEGVRALEIAGEDGIHYAPTMENAIGGIYPLARFLYIYSAGEPTGIARQFLDFALSEIGQSVVDGVGYYPLPREMRGNE